MREIVPSLEIILLSKCIVGVLSVQYYNMTIISISESGENPS